jgi:hypothetical protein
VCQWSGLLWLLPATTQRSSVDFSWSHIR